MHQRLRHAAFSLSFIFCALSLQAQWVSIPDTNFGKWLNTNGYSQCLQGNSNVGWQMDTTCGAVVNETMVICYESGIQNIDGIQYFDKLDRLVCALNQLTSLPALPDSLRFLDCEYNQLTTLPTLPNSLSQLFCGGNQLVSLPDLPSSLTDLRCYVNQLTSLPFLPNQLNFLNLGHNEVTVLPSLPSSLIELWCNHNQLSNLPSLPASIRWLDCNSNQISFLPELPDSLATLRCDDNALFGLPELPRNLEYLNCSNNLNLVCLPELKAIDVLRFTSTGVTCLPNYPSFNIFSFPALESMLLCNPINPNGCSVYWNIKGQAFHDSIQDCLIQNFESQIRGINVQLWTNGAILEQATTVDGGNYSFLTDTGVVEVRLDNSVIPFEVACPSASFYVSTITALDSFDTDMNFGLRCKPGFDLEARSIASPTFFRPANFTEVEIGAGDASNFYGAHCALGTSGAVEVNFSGPVQFVGAVPGALTPTQNGNTLTYTIADFGAVNFFDAFNFILQTDTFAQIGQQVCFTVSVTPTAGDNDTSNNTLTHCFPIVNSYDPNDKTAYPAGDIDTAQKELTYTIRFQNTGNAEAQHIYITDTLSQFIDESSFRLLGYSHQPMVQIKGKAVRFNFPNINLPDSFSNEPASHGYVQYKVKLNSNLPIGTQIDNTAFIYFDYNAPVVTNTTTNTVSLPQACLHL